MVMCTGYNYPEVCASLSGKNKVPAECTSHHTGAVDGEEVVGKTPVQETESGGQVCRTCEETEQGLGEQDHITAAEDRGTCEWFVR